MNEEQKKITAINALAANFKDNIDNNLLSLWLDLLEDIPAALLAEACKQIILKRVYRGLPQFAEIMQEIESLSGNGKIALSDEAHDAWEDIQAKIRSVGSYRTPQLTDRQERAVRKMGGWLHVCQILEKALPFEKKRFLEYYAEAQETDRVLKLSGTIGIGCGK